MYRNETLCLLESLTDRMATIVLTLQIRVQALDLQATRAFVLLPSESFGFVVHSVLPVHAISVMQNVFKCVLGIALVY